MLSVWFSWSLCASYMSGIYWLSSSSFVPVPAFFITYDFISHALLYGVLAGLLSWALFESGARKRFYIYAFVIAVLYGAGDELLQVSVPHRSASLVDLLADGLGASIGACAALAARRFFEKPPGPKLQISRLQNPQPRKHQKGASIA